MNSQPRCPHCNKYLPLLHLGFRRIGGGRRTKYKWSSTEHWYKKGYGLRSSYRDRTTWDYSYWITYQASINRRFLEE
jgi:hypothetical protein